MSMHRDPTTGKYYIKKTGPVGATKMKNFSAGERDSDFYPVANKKGEYNANPIEPIKVGDILDMSNKEVIKLLRHFRLDANLVDYPHLAYLDEHYVPTKLIYYILTLENQINNGKFEGKFIVFPVNKDCQRVNTDVPEFEPMPRSIDDLTEAQCRILGRHYRTGFGYDASVGEMKRGLTDLFKIPRRNEVKYYEYLLEMIRGFINLGGVENTLRLAPKLEEGFRVLGPSYLELVDFYTTNTRVEGETLQHKLGVDRLHAKHFG